MTIVPRWTGLEASVLRKTLRLTAEDFANRLGVSTRQVETWESRGEDVVPMRVMQEALDTLLSWASEHDRRAFLAQVAKARPPGSLRSVPDVELEAHATAESIVAFTGKDIAMQQGDREFALLTGADVIKPVRRWATTVPVAVSRGDQGSTAEVEDLRKAVVVFREWDASGTGGLQREAVIGQLNAIARTVYERKHASTTRSRLFGVVAELAQLSGWMTFDAGFHTLAQQYFLQALDACTHAELPELAAKIIGDLAQLSKFHGYYEDGLALLGTALATLPQTANMLVRSELRGHEACCYAKSKSERMSDAQRCIDAALDAFAASTVDDGRHWNRYMDQSEVECLAASTHLLLALNDAKPQRAATHAERAENHARAASAARQPGYARSRVFDQIRLSKVRYAQQEPAEAARLASDAIHRAHTVQSSLVITRLIEVKELLIPRYGDVREVAEFGSDLVDYVRTSERGEHEG